MYCAGQQAEEKSPQSQDKNCYMYKRRKSSLALSVSCSIIAYLPICMVLVGDREPLHPSLPPNKGGRLFVASTDTTLHLGKCRCSSLPPSGGRWLAEGQTDEGEAEGLLNFTNQSSKACPLQHLAQEGLRP